MRIGDTAEIWCSQGPSGHSNTKERGQLKTVRCDPQDEDNGGIYPTAGKIDTPWMVAPSKALGAGLIGVVDNLS